MDFDLTSEQEMIRKSIAEFIAKECPFEKVKELEESDLGYSPELWQKMAELGWMKVYFPEEFGGYGDPFMNVVIILEEMGKAAFQSPFFSTVIQCGLIILEGGSQEQKKELLPKIAEGHHIIALAQHEKEVSYLPLGIKMLSQSSDGHYILDGHKMFVTDANISDAFIVVCKTGDVGITLFLLDAKDPGIKCTKMPTIGMDNTCEVIFKNVKVQKKNVIGKPGDGWKILEKVSQKAIVAKCSEMLGGCKASINMTAAYAKKRVQYRKPIGAFQVIQHYMPNA